MANTYLYSGGGNTFLLQEKLPTCTDIVACCEKYAVDGLLVLEENRIYFFNADGSTAGLCGNGARCALYHQLQKTKQTKVTLLLHSLQLDGTLHAPGRVAMTWEMPLIKKGQKTTPYGTITDVDAGAQHWVLPCQFTNCTLLLDTAKILAQQAHFDRNITFVDTLSNRFATYERGVHAFTGSCGTGALAATLCHYPTGLSCLIAPSGATIETVIKKGAATAPAILSQISSVELLQTV